MTPRWPTHPDGRPKKMGELTPAERRAQVRTAMARLKQEMESPEFAEALKRAADQIQPPSPSP